MEKERGAEITMGLRRRKAAAAKKYSKANEGKREGRTQRRKKCMK